MWLAELARERAHLTPNRVAYRWLDRNLDEAAVLTYAELDQKASAIGAALAACTSPHARVFVILPSGLDYVVAMFACLYASRTIVPGIPPRRRDSAASARFSALLADAQPELVIAPATLAKWIPAGTPCTTLEALAAVDASSTLVRDDNQLSVLQYTSGSTSIPKGAMITEAALRSNLAQISARFEHTPESSAVLWLPMHHDMGLVGGVLEPMHGGFPATLLSPLDFVQRPCRWLRAIARYRGTTSGGPAFAYRMCVERIRDDQLEALDLSSWQVAFVGAERVSAPVLRSFATRFARYGFRERAVLPCYGLAETTLMAASRTKGSGLVADASAAEHVSCGTPVEGHDLRIVDAETGKPCADGEIGEIWLRGPSVARGYWRRPEVTARTFGAKLPGLSEREAYLRTGDLGFLREGELFITGRLKETIIVRGMKHAPEDLESTVAASHPCFASAAGAAFSCESEQGESFVVACEVRRSAWSEPDVEAATAAAVEAIVRVHDVRPHAIVLVKPGAIPRTTSGKVQRTLCRELFEHGALGGR